MMLFKDMTAVQFTHYYCMPTCTICVCVYMYVRKHGYLHNSTYYIGNALNFLLIVSVKGHAYTMYNKHMFVRECILKCSAILIHLGSS